MAEIPQTPEAVAYKLMQDLLSADGKMAAYNTKNDKGMASRAEIAEAFKEARGLVKGIGIAG